MTSPNATDAPDQHDGTAPEQRRIRRQRLGRRLDATPYYEIVEQSDTRLVLQSRPDANKAVGQRSIMVGIVLILMTPLGIIGLMVAGINAIFGALLLWPFAAIGWLVYQSGRAVATTVNTITADRASATLVFKQENRINRPRSQTLQFEQLARLWLQPRRYARNRWQRMRDTTALELITDEGELWIIDSAADADTLKTTGHALANVLAIPFADRPTP